MLPPPGRSPDCHRRLIPQTAIRLAAFWNRFLTGFPYQPRISIRGLYKGETAMYVKLEPTPVATAPSQIRYIREDFPPFALPSGRGDRYTRLVPDTLDLQERAALAVHGLTAPTDPAADYEIYWILFPRTRPPLMQHDWCDLTQAKYMEVLPLVRLASGSELNLHVERRWLETIFQMQGPDGLLYYPKIGRPWWQVVHFGAPTPGDHYFSLYAGGRLLNAITIYDQLTGDEVWRAAGRQFVDGLARLALDEGGLASFQWMQYGPGGSLPPGVDPRFTPGYNMANWTAPNIGALAHTYRTTGYAPALELAGKLARWVVQRSNHFDANGTFIHEPARSDASISDAKIADVAGGNPGLAPYAHFHGHTITLLALLEYALLAGDREVLDLVTNGYRYGRAQGDLLTGYFPEVVGRGNFEDCETCCVADMVSLALKLSAAGLGDYWDEADRWLRNQLVENQMTQADWTWRFWEMGPAHPRDFDLRNSQLDPTHQTADRALERHIGGFASHAAANDFSHGRSGVTGCCTGNGARTLYQAWEHILDYADGKLRVNLLLNRASPWADVDSYIPYEGQVDISMKQSCDLAVRLPEWVQPDQVICCVDGAARAVGCEGRYAQVGQVGAGQVVVLAFPIAERLDQIYIQKHRFTLVRKGNEVVSIDPPGQYYPLYQRDHYRQREVRWRQMERFVPQKSIAW
ncbi:MAG: hypothetical protein EXR62_10620 [Chloroflexi bacterium]|nr:hypothetical protein [Chloroflexota bacterium]